MSVYCSRDDSDDVIVTFYSQRRVTTDADFDADQNYVAWTRCSVVKLQRQNAELRKMHEAKDYELQQLTKELDEAKKHYLDVRCVL